VVAEPFPRLLRWALLVPFAIYAAAYLLVVFWARGNHSSSDLVGILFWVFIVAGVVVEVVAVPLAIFLLVARTHYVSA
jgi:hypothetical protein